jgi:hypothetical protein
VTVSIRPLCPDDIDVNHGHAPARRLYERAGFTPVPLVRYFKTLP